MNRIELDEVPCACGARVEVDKTRVRNTTSKYNPLGWPWQPCPKCDRPVIVGTIERQ